MVPRSGEFRRMSACLLDRSSATMVPMDWIWVLGVLAVIAAFLAFKRVGSVSPRAAGQHLRQGARLIDVRTVEEFSARHLPGAINIPLADLEREIGRHVPDKQQVLLLHCLGGVRSGQGRRLLKRMGYTRVYNLGSYRRAEKIVQGSGT